MQRLMIAACCGFLVLVVGCSTRGTSSVSGEVRFNGQPLKSGTVFFIGADDQKKHSAIGTDGKYMVKGTRPGLARITVVSHPRVPPGLNPGAPPESLPPVPNRYEEAASSGLSVEVSGGRQTHDIDLVP